MTDWRILMWGPVFTFDQATSGSATAAILIVAPAVAFCLWRWPRGRETAQRMWWLFALPLPWVLLSYWMEAHLDAGDGERLAAYWAGGIAISATLLGGIALAVVLKGARLIAALLTVLNTYLVLVGALLCIIATIGVQF